jgi:hypothetical protein
MSNGDFAVTIEAVLDAGPLIHLSELEALDTLSDFSALYVSPTVCNEVERYQPNALNLVGIHLQLVPALPPSATLNVLARTLALDIGEVEGDLDTQRAQRTSHRGRGYGDTVQLAWQVYSAHKSLPVE